MEMSAAWKAVEHRREQRQRRRFQTNRVECGCECGCADWDYMACGIVEEEIPSVVAQSPVVKPGEAKARLVLSSDLRLSWDARMEIRSVKRAPNSERERVY